MLAEFPTTLEEDEATLATVADGSFFLSLTNEEDEAERESAEQYAVAVAYRATVKRLLAGFVEECLEMGVEPSEW